MKPQVKITKRAIDWIPIREDFVQRNMSQPELATKYSISENAIARHSVSEGWVKQREMFQADVIQSSREKGINEAAKLNARKLEVGRWLANLGIKSLRKYEKEGVNIEDDRLAVEAVQKGFALQSEALGLNESASVDMKALIVNITVRPEELQDFMKWRNERRRFELERPIPEVAISVDNRVDSTEQS
jgi:hypothetical protein